MYLRPLLAIAFAACLPLTAQTRHKVARHEAPAVDETAIHNVFWQPNELHQGSPVFLTVELDKPATRVTGNFVNKPFLFFHEENNLKVWHALGGVDLETNPGQYGLDVTATLPGGRVAKKSTQVTVAPGDFKTGDINVPENFVNPSDAEQKQIANDEVLKKRAYSHTAPHILWSGDFAKPVPAPPTPSFGESRILNEEKTSLHTGTDYPVKEGTPVLAANAGTVVLTRDLFYEGATVIVDHGQGLFTVYLHLSRTDVKEGDKLKKGDHLGLSGASGRVTGPHLHFGVRWQGAWLDPVQVLALTLPQTSAAPPEHKPASHHKR